MHYRHARQALAAVRQNVGFLVTGLSLVRDDLREGRVVRPFPAEQHLPAPKPYVLHVAGPEATRPQLKRFCDWLRSEAARTRQELGTQGAAEGPGPGA